jgi:hypothetical protein
MLRERMRLLVFRGRRLYVPRGTSFVVRVVHAGRWSGRCSCSHSLAKLSAALCVGRPWTISCAQEDRNVARLSEALRVVEPDREDIDSIKG